MSNRALLLDENLSPRLVAKLESDFPGIAHVSQFNMRGMPDIEVWRFAGEHGYCIVSRDSDFNQLAFLNDPPPQVIWLRLGDLTTGEVADQLRRHKEAIQAFLGQDDQTVLEIP
jgi:predicted nuclease of predicted toxin-antitoxin system